MATKGDLVEAQRYSRRRLRTAFTSGIPRGVELEPRNYLRSIVGGTAVAVLMIVGSLLFGYLKPGLPKGWENDRLLIGTSTGVRYVSRDGTLHPVANLSSARLLIAAGQFQVLRVDERRISAAPRGPALGIVGAPDFLPRAQDLVNSGWSACHAEGVTAVTLGDAGVVARADDDQAAVVRVGERRYLLMGGYRYDLPESAGEYTSVLRQLGLDTADAVEVSAQWVNVFTAGKPLTQWSILGAGDPAKSAPKFRIGDIVTFDPDGEGQKYILTDHSEFAPISEFALLLYGQGDVGEPRTRVATEADVAQLVQVATPNDAAGWPTASPHPLKASTALCAALTTDAKDRVVPALALPADGTIRTGYEASDGRRFAVPPAGGALVEVRPVRGVASPTTLYLVDSLGSAYPIPHADADALARLGYTANDIGTISPGWVELFTPGPALTTAGALAVVAVPAPES